MEISAPSHHLTIRGILAEAIHLFRKKLFSAVVLAAIFVLPITLANFLMRFWAKSSLLLILSSLIALLWMILSCISSGALLVMFGKAYLSSDIKLSETIRAGSKYLLNLLGASFITRGIAIGIPIICIFSFFAIAGFGNMGFFASLALTSPYILFLLIRWNITESCIVLENIGAQAALKRSWRLTKRAFWHVLAIQLLLYLLNFTISILPATLLGYKFNSAVDFTKTGALLGSLWTPLSMLITFPLSRIVNIVLYYELQTGVEQISSIA